MDQDLRSVRHARRGHFEFESGHHGDLWLELETLCLHSTEIRPFAAQLAAKLSQHKSQVPRFLLVNQALRMDR